MAGRVSPTTAKLSDASVPPPGPKVDPELEEELELLELVLEVLLVELLLEVLLVELVLEVLLLLLEVLLEQDCWQIELTSFTQLVSQSVSQQ